MYQQWTREDSTSFFFALSIEPSFKASYDVYCQTDIKMWTKDLQVTFHVTNLSYPCIIICKKLNLREYKRAIKILIWDTMMIEFCFNKRCTFFCCSITWWWLRSHVKSLLTLLCDFGLVEVPSANFLLTFCYQSLEKMNTLEGPP